MAEKIEIDVIERTSVGDQVRNYTAKQVAGKEHLAEVVVVDGGAYLARYWKSVFINGFDITKYVYDISYSESVSDGPRVTLSLRATLRKGES